MKNKKLLKDLNEVYSDLQDLSDERLSMVTKYLAKAEDKLGGIIQGIEDGDYDEEKEENEEKDEE